MVQSILDNDLYKFTMQNAVVKLFPRAKARYEFIDRNNTVFPEGFVEKLKFNVDELSNLKLTKEEKKFLDKKCYYFDQTYLDFLMGYRFDPSEVEIIQIGTKLKITIEDFWYRAILWEVPLLATISELYFNFQQSEIYAKEKIIDIAKWKADQYNKLNVTVADFGTRRRYSAENHNLVVEILAKFGPPSFIGTSNVFFAQKHGITPIGTHAHEWFMFHSAKFGFKMADKLALENWVNVYRGDLGIALSDTFTSDVFFNSFDKKFAKLFDGVRHDSGDPLEFAEKTIKHYQKLNIDPKSKSIIFSDSLNADKIKEIAQYCKDKVKISFGIGTNLTNDVGVTPLNIVIKMSAAKPEGQNWTPAIKLSDVPGKYSGDPKTIQLCKDTLKID